MVIEWTGKSWTPPTFDEWRLPLVYYFLCVVLAGPGPVLDFRRTTRETWRTHSWASLPAHHQGRVDSEERERVEYIAAFAVDSMLDRKSD